MEPADGTKSRKKKHPYTEICCVMEIYLQDPWELKC